MTQSFQNTPSSWSICLPPKRSQCPSIPPLHGNGKWPCNCGFWIIPATVTLQGFPFDPYLLYRHRRVVRAHAALEHWLARAPASCSVLRSFFHLSSRLKQYLADAIVIEAATIYENAFCIFSAYARCPLAQRQRPLPFKRRLSVASRDNTLSWPRLSSCCVPNIAKRRLPYQPLESQTRPHRGHSSGR